MKNLFFVTLLVLGTAACSDRRGLTNGFGAEIRGEDKPAVIWDQDTREEVESNDPDLSLAHSTAVLFFKHTVTKIKDGSFQILMNPMRVNFPVCEDERFREQDMLGHCSGVLIGPRTVLTAGHCVRDEKFCGATYVSFGRTQEKAKLQKLTADEVYSCSKIIKTIERAGKDYAIIELDRDVTQATPVMIGKGANLQAEETVLSLSYPLGLPLKKDQAKILKNDPMDYIMKVRVDTYSGSSGSPLFNSNNEVVGILIKGSDDFPEKDDELRHHFIDGTCVNSKKCKDGFCNGELYLKTDAMDF